MTTLDADARLDAQGFPDALDLWVLADRLQGARMRLIREQQVWDVAVDVAGGKIAPELSLTRSALVGAAVGSLLMPGVGTGAGVALGEKIGDKLQNLFGK